MSDWCVICWREWKARFRHICDRFCLKKWHTLKYTGLVLFSPVWCSVSSHIFIGRLYEVCKHVAVLRFQNFALFVWAVRHVNFCLSQWREFGVGLPVCANNDRWGQNVKSVWDTKSHSESKFGFFISQWCSDDCITFVSQVQSSSTDHTLQNILHLH